MTVWHDAYLFNPEKFAVLVAPYVKLLETREGYTLLRASVLRLYYDNARVRACAQEYGGWDEHTIEVGISADTDERDQDIAFWLSLLLYSVIELDPHALGLRSSWRLLDGLLDKFAWNESDKNLLVRGRSFGTFAEHYLHEATDSSSRLTPQFQYWNSVRPYATAGQAGWIDAQDVGQLLDRLLRHQSAIPQLHLPGYGDAEIQGMRDLYRVAQHMLKVANERNCGLCFILSG